MNGATAAQTTAAKTNKSLGKKEKEHSLEYFFVVIYGNNNAVTQKRKKITANPFQIL